MSDDSIFAARRQLIQYGGANIIITLSKQQRLSCNCQSD